MQNDTVKLILRSKSFPIPYIFRHLIDISAKISRSLIYNSNHEYQVESTVSDEVFLSFIDYLVNDKLPEIEIETFNEFFLLSEEFEILQDFVEEKRGQFGEYLVNLNGLKDNKNFSYLIYAEKVALKLYDYIENYGDILIKLPIQTLHIVFNHEKRNLTNHNRAYEMINKYFERTNDRNVFILLESLDGSKLSKSNIDESFKKRKSRLNYMPNIEFFYLSDSFEKQRKLEEKVTELENIIKIMNKHNEKVKNQILLKHQNEMKNLQIEISKEIDWKINELKKKFDEDKNLLIAQNKEEILNIKKNHANEIDVLKKQINLHKEKLTKIQSSLNEHVNEHQDKNDADIFFNDDEINNEDEKEEEENNDDEISDEYEKEEEENNDAENDYRLVNQAIREANANMLTTVIVRNIPFSATAKDLGNFLNEKFGDIKDVRILQERYFGKLYSRGIGFAEFKTQESCKKAISADFVEFKAPDETAPRRLRIFQAIPKKPSYKVFIKGIPQGTTEEDIINAFQPVKPIKVKMLRYDSDINIKNTESRVFKMGKRSVRFAGRRRFRRRHAPRNNLNSET